MDGCKYIPGKGDFNLLLLTWFSKVGCHDSASLEEVTYRSGNFSVGTGKGSRKKMPSLMSPVTNEQILLQKR